MEMTLTVKSILKRQIKKLSINASVNNTNIDEFNCNFNPLEIWKQLYKRLELEINNLWQRSIFLASFIILAFTGYGCYFSKLFINCKSCCILGVYHIPGIFLGCVISILGVLWIALAKGSKYWFEIYEKKIAIFEHNYLCNHQQYAYVEEKAMKDEKLKYDIFNKDNVLVNDSSFFSFSASAYSPSRINILLGWIIGIIGIIICILHYVLLYSKCVNICKSLYYIVGTTFPLITIIFSIIIWKKVKHTIR